MKAILTILIFSSALSALGQELKINEPVKFLALGDSYTIGESVFESGRWPAQLMDSLEIRGYATADLRIIARTGWRTDNLMQAISSENPPKDYNLVSLLIGVNDQYQGYDEVWYEPRFEELLQIAVEHAGGNKNSVFVVSIPDYAYTPYGQQLSPSLITEDINSFNSINRSITESYGIKYFDITPISREGLDNTALVASDGLHPSSLMYSRWVALIMEDIIKGETTSSDTTVKNSREVKAFPNPAHDTLVFDLPGSDPEGAKVLVYNQSGQLVMQSELNRGSSDSIDTSSLKPGIYFYRILAEENDYSGKFIKSY